MKALDAEMEAIYKEVVRLLAGLPSESIREVVASLAGSAFIDPLSLVLRAAPYMHRVNEAIGKMSDEEYRALTEKARQYVSGGAAS